MTDPTPATAPPVDPVEALARRLDSYGFHDPHERTKMLSDAARLLRDLAKDKARLDDLERDGRVLCFEINVDGGWTVTLTEDENGEMQHFVAHDLREAIDRAMDSA